MNLVIQRIILLNIILKQQQQDQPKQHHQKQQEQQEQQYQNGFLNSRKKNTSEVQAHIQATRGIYNSQSPTRSVHGEKSKRTTNGIEGVWRLCDTLTLVFNHINELSFSNFLLGVPQKESF